MQRIEAEICLMCQNTYKRDLSWQQLFSWEAIEFQPLCPDCLRTFVSYDYQAENCTACGRNLDGSNKFQASYRFNDSDEYYCLDCYRWRKVFPLKVIKNLAIFDYNDSFRDWITRYKYEGDCRLAEVMKKPLKKFYKQYANYLWLVLPSSDSSLKRRLFHPTGYLLEIAEIPYYCPFYYNGDGKRQAEKNRTERLVFTRPFSWTGIEEENLKEKKGLLIFDDVYTTGATMIQAKIEIMQNFEAIHKERMELKSITLARDQSLIENV